MHKVFLVVFSVLSVAGVAAVEKADIISVQGWANVVEPGVLKTPQEDIPFQKMTALISGPVVAVAPQPIEIPEDDLTSKEEPVVIVLRKELDPKFCSADVEGIPEYSLKHKDSGMLVRGTKKRTLPVSGNSVIFRYANGNLGQVYVSCK